LKPNSNFTTVKCKYKSSCHFAFRCNHTKQ